jgi:hypothetical protein
LGDLPADGDPAAVDVVPGDAAQLAAAHAGERGQVIERVEPVASMTSRNAPSSSAVQTFTLGTTTFGRSASGATLRAMMPAFDGALQCAGERVVDAPQAQRPDRPGHRNKDGYARPAGVRDQVLGVRLGAALNVDLLGCLDLRGALELVRGVPFAGADRPSGGRNPYAWLPESEINPPHLVAAVVDTAHHLAALCLDSGDTAGARWAVAKAWTADPYRGDDEPWHDLMRAEHTDGNTAELRSLLDDLMRVRDAEIPEDLQPTTYALLQRLHLDQVG